MKVSLLHYTPLHVAAHAIRTCWQSFEKGDGGGPKDRELIDRVGNRYRHASTLEHLVYTFYIQGISRALLQELARHRIASLSVKSTRYTLKELKKEPPFDPDDPQRASRYLVFTGHPEVDRASIEALERLRHLLASGVSNDLAKYCLPESYKSELTWTINARSLQNFLSLRSAKTALWEMRHLSWAIFETLPADHRYLFEPYITPKDQPCDN
ncbi:MAG: thymidylate synthase (FAD) [Nitratiruptor sp.]|nr:thymidylate synthase (FAD) [Nitratiruptor sp.]NPA82931.1 FAD-dependent thymidylate synthase [Campylobacterota bacterium]